MNMSRSIIQNDFICGRLKRISLELGLQSFGIMNENILKRFENYSFFFVDKDFLYSIQNGLSGKIFHFL